MVTALQQILDQRGGDGKLLIADLVEQILDDMGKPDDGLQTKQARRPLDGVSCTEDSANQLAIVRVSLQ